MFSFSSRITLFLYHAALSVASADIDAGIIDLQSKWAIVAHINYSDTNTRRTEIAKLVGLARECRERERERYIY